MGGIAPLLVSFGTGMLKRYNQRKRASSAAEYDQILLDDKQEHELKKLSEERDFQYQLADYKHDQARSVEREKNQWAINDKLAEFNMETDRDKKIAIQEQLDALALQEDLYEKKGALATHENTFASAANALAESNKYEVFGNGTTSFKLFQYLDKNDNPIETKRRDLAMMRDLNELGDSAGFKDIVLALPDAELQRFKTYATQVFNSYRISNASKSDTGEFLAWARIKPNKQGKGAFTNLFDEEKYPAELGIGESYEASTNYIKTLTFQEAKKKNKNITSAFTKESEDGLYDYILTLDDITKLYPGVPMDDVMALAEITKAYNPELYQQGTSGIEAQLEVIYNLQDRPQDLLAVKHANAFASTGRMSEGNKLVTFWNENTEAYGPSDGYEIQPDGSKRYVGINHEARLESLALGVVPVIMDNSNPAFVSVLDNKKVDEAQKLIVASSGPMIADIKNIGTQGTTSLDLIRNILTTYEPSYGGSPFTGSSLDLLVLLEGFTEQVGLLPQTFSKNETNSIMQQIFTDNKLTHSARESLSTFELDDKKYNVADHIDSMDKRLQLAAQRKFFATALNYTVSMILQGGTGGKTISDTDYEIMNRAMYNGLFTSQGLNMSALEAIYKTIELPIILAQYKTDLSNKNNAIQNMQAAMMYERLIQFNGKQQYFELRDKLMKYAEPTVQVSVKKEDYFNGRAHLGKYTPNVTPRKEKTEDGKNILYFRYFKGGDEQEKLPMKLEDVKKYWPRYYDSVKADYADFDNPVFDTYKTYFKEDENQDSSNIVKENWNLLGGLVDDDKTPDVTE